MRWTFLLLKKGNRDQLKIADVQTQLERDLLIADDLPVEGTYKDDFLLKNKDVMKIGVFKKLDNNLRKTFDKDQNITCRVMWFMVYNNLNSFMTRGMRSENKANTLKRVFNIPEKALTLKTWKEANNFYRTHTLPVLARLLIAIEGKINQAATFIEEAPMSPYNDLKAMTTMTKDFKSLRDAYTSAYENYVAGKKRGEFRDKNDKLLSAVETGSIWED